MESRVGGSTSRLTIQMASCANINDDDKLRQNAHRCSNRSRTTRQADVEQGSDEASHETGKAACRHEICRRHDCALKVEVSNRSTEALK